MDPTSGEPIPAGEPKTPEEALAIGQTFLTPHPEWTAMVRLLESCATGARIQESTLVDDTERGIVRGNLAVPAFGISGRFRAKGQERLVVLTSEVPASSSGGDVTWTARHIVLKYRMSAAQPTEVTLTVEHRHRVFNSSDSDMTREDASRRYESTIVGYRAEFTPSPHQIPIHIVVNRVGQDGWITGTRPSKQGQEIEAPLAASNFLSWERFFETARS